MAYGMEVKNSSDRTIFTTEEEFCLYTYGSIISSNTNGLVVTNYDEDDFSDGKLLFARPQNGESGAICGKLTSSNYTFFGEGEYGWGTWQTHEDDFPSAPGVKYTIATRLDTSTPGTGYGLKVTKSNGTDLIMDSGSLTKRMNILDIVGGGTSTTDPITYTKPGSVAFNEIFVVASQFQAKMSWSPAAGYTPAGSMVAGTWAYFDNSAGTITFYNGYIFAWGTQIIYDASGTNNTFVGTQKVQYIIMHLPLG